MISALIGKRILVTGGSMGLGQAVARHLATAGARVMIAGRSATALDAALAELEGA
ncbi:MAG: SDR family NAD(P)-dependent oxidoreductase, partial [Solirubrobacterales bacterium]|nr:SDR family NAD(P)-dependent oxidoreductase [Solirubrobacterales bacterium]